MRKNPDFELIQIENDTYLLPCGQAICDHKKGMKINETGALIWELADSSKSKDELIASCIEIMEISDADRDQAASDIDAFLTALISSGMLIIASESSPRSGSYEGISDRSSVPCIIPSGIKMYAAKPLRINIAGINISIFCDKTDMDPKLFAFRCINTGEMSPSDQTVCVIYTLPPSDDERKKFIHSKEMDFYTSDRGYIISYNEYSPIKEVHMSYDGKMVSIYAIKAPDLTYHLFHAFRLPFLYLAEKKGLYAIHSASILYNNKAWLFSAPSGTGKSTHAALWTGNTDATNINGDLNLIGMQDDKAVVLGIPWCGTSEIYDSDSHLLGGVIFLKQAKENRLEDLNTRDQIISLTRRTVSPVLSGETLQQMVNDLLPMTNSVYMKRLHCNKDLSALHLVQASIDTWVQRS